MLPIYVFLINPLINFRDIVPRLTSAERGACVWSLYQTWASLWDCLHAWGHLKLMNWWESVGRSLSRPTSVQVQYIGSLWAQRTAWSMSSVTVGMQWLWAKDETNALPPVCETPELQEGVPVAIGLWPIAVPWERKALPAESLQDVCGMWVIYNNKSLYSRCT